MKKNFAGIALLVAAVLHLAMSGAAAGGLRVFVVSADIVATTESPGFEYRREGKFIPYVEGLREALVYGNIVYADPAAKKPTEVFDLEKRPLGFLSPDSLALLPMHDTFAPEPFRFSVDSPDLFLLPEKLPLLSYTLEGHDPFYVLAGEVVDGIGSFMDENGREWTLLRFSTEPGADLALSDRYAWTRSENVMRLSRYVPNSEKVESSLVPRTLRDIGVLGDEYYDRILRDGFVISARPVFIEDLKLDDMVQAYPDSTYLPVFAPNFITSDLFLHAFHLVFSRALRNIEEIDFAPRLETLLMEALDELSRLEKKAGKDVFVRKTIDRARDFLSVPALLISPDLPLNPSENVKGELARILKIQRLEPSAITGQDVDYSFYKPRGHYAGNENSERYFRAMSYLGSMSVSLNGAEGMRKENVALISVLCMLFRNERLFERWDALYSPLAFMVGESDDPSVRDFLPAVDEILKGSPDLLRNPETLETLYKEFIEAAPPQRIVDVAASRPGMNREERLAEAAGFRMMGRRFVLDAWIFGRLTSPAVGSDEYPRNLPRTTDVMGVLGSDIAETLLESVKKTIPGYAGAFEATQNDVRGFLSKTGDNVYSDWLRMLASLFSDEDSKQLFCSSSAWKFKKLLTASASWAELKHDTVLYAKQSYAEMGGGGEWVVVPFGRPVPRGYVEPAPRLFGAMYETLDRMRTLIAQYGLGEREDERSWHGVRAKIEAFQEHVRIFKEIAEKETADKPLSMDDYIAISQITSYLNSNLLLDLSAADLIDEDDADRLKMPLLSDVATDMLDGRVLYAGTGTPRRIYVFVDDVHAGPRVAVGYTYSFYEFIRPLADGRMTDEEWKTLVYDKQKQEELDSFMPEWGKELFVR